MNTYKRHRFRQNRTHQHCASQLGDEVARLAGILALYAARRSDDGAAKYSSSN
ncbi:MAG TPA: hypothetical protein QF499_09610 [Gammaproteobacteria bacterium]|jgi:hypothetical protein|nr:hypothetical protein [Gammaproteobacteria bacterium]MDP7661154.1 hypothetical protein [Gammaproteobacteria bacterium]HJP39368.1 hypothetical protein [Gammaproteobacteria bacterium]